MTYTPRELNLDGESSLPEETSFYMPDTDSFAADTTTMYVVNESAVCHPLGIL